GRKGVQILGLEEIFNGPYFCPSQDPHWYDIAESVPGPTTELMAKFAKQYKMAMVVPVYEREQAGVYYNTAAVYDADGSYLGKYRKNHIPHTSGFWEKYFFKPSGNFLATASEDKDELLVAEMDLDMIEEVRRVWQFYRDRRPDSYGPMAQDSTL